MIGPETRIRSDVVLGDDVADARQRLELGGRDRAREAQLDLVMGEVAQRLDAVDAGRARPSRMIATRSQVFSTSLRMWLERKTVRPSSRASRTSAKNDCWTSGSRPEVGSSRISSSGRCWSAMTSPIFCLLPFE